MTKKLLAEVLGTFILVFFGCGSAVFMGAEIGMLGISLAFGLAIVAAAYSLGHISGAHLNPAVSLGMLTAGRMGLADFIGYAIAQVLGAILAALVIMLIAQGRADYSLATNGLGQNGYGAGYLGEYSLTAALLFETVATFLFVLVFAWNEYLLALFLSSSHAQTMPLTVAAQNATRGPQWWYMSVLIMIMILPVIVMAIILERYIARGLLIGAVKG